MGIAMTSKAYNVPDVASNLYFRIDLAF